MNRPRKEPLPELTVRRHLCLAHLGRLTRKDTVIVHGLDKELKLKLCRECAALIRGQLHAMYRIQGG